MIIGQVELGVKDTLISRKLLKILLILIDKDEDKLSAKQVSDFQSFIVVSMSCLQDIIVPNKTKYLALFSKITSNAFSILDSEGIDLGVGIYEKVCSLVNHSCTPNSVVHFEGGEIEVRNIKGIEQGEEITISYCNLNQPKNLLRQEIKERYFFDPGQVKF